MNRDRKLGAAVIACVAALALVRFVGGSILELIPEEAYYWTYSAHPALGYFDHPPMVAWGTWLGTKLLGHTELGVRLMTILWSLGSCGLLYLTGRLWFGERAALWASLLFTALPVFAGAGFVTTPDSPLLFFWMVALYAITKALHTQRASFWLLAGVGLGGALLSKYYALLLAPSLLVFLLRSKRYRFWLSRPSPWLALVLALAVFSPVIVWNAQHQWASFLFQSTRTVEPEPAKINTLFNVFYFWLLQLIVLSPILFVFFGAAVKHGVWRGWLGGEDNWNFAASFSLPLFVMFALASLKTQVHINWTAPSFLSLALGAGAILSEREPWPKSWRVTAIVAGVWCIVSIVFALASLGGLAVGKFSYTAAVGWRQLGQQMRAERDGLAKATGQEPFLIGADKYNLAAEMSFYTDLPAECVNLYALCGQGLGFRFWTDLRRFERRPAIVVLSRLREDRLAEVRAHFDDFDAPRLVSISRGPAAPRILYVLHAYGYHIEHRANSTVGRGG